MSSKLAPIDGITDGNRGGEVIVFVIAAGCFSVLFTIIRFGTAIQRRLGFGADDAFFVLCLVLAIVQAVTIGFAVHNGLGQHAASLTADQIGNFFKDTYTSRIVSALSMACAKFSVCCLYNRLEFYTSWRTHLIPFVSSAAWMVVSVIALAFSCSLPSPWLISSSHCPSGSGVMIAVAVVNAVTDAVLALYPIPTLWQLTMSLNSRLTVVVLFSSRILVCVMAGIDAIYESRIFVSQDQTWDQTKPMITGVVLVNISLIAAAAPRLHNYFSKIPSGTLAFHIPSTLYLSRGSRYNRTATQATTNSRYSGNAGTSGIPRLVPDDYPVTLTTNVSSRHNQSTNGRAPDGTGGDHHSIEEDKSSAGSSKSAWSDGIYRTVKVHYQAEREDEKERGSGSSLTKADSGRG